MLPFHLYNSREKWINEIYLFLIHLQNQISNLNKSLKLSPNPEAVSVGVW